MPMGIYLHPSDVQGEETALEWLGSLSQDSRYTKGSKESLCLSA